MIASFLWTDIIVEFIRHSAGVDADILRVFAVDISLNRTTTVIFDILEALGHWQLHSEAEHIRLLSHDVAFYYWHVTFLVAIWVAFAISLCLCLIDSHLLGHLDSTFVVDYIGHGKLGGNLWHVILCNDDCLIVFLFLVERNQLHVRVLPASIFALEVSSEVVVGRSSPKVWSELSIFGKNLEPANFIEADETIAFSEVNLEVISLYDKIVHVVVDYFRHVGAYLFGFFGENRLCGFLD